MTTKTCTKCGETKPLDQYSRQRRNRDGRRPQCKACVRAHYQENREAILAQQREYSARPEVKAARAAYGVEYLARPGMKAAKAEYYAERYAANPHLWWESFARQRAHRYGHDIIVESFTREELIDRYGDQCWHCGGEFEELDHFPVPISRGGHHVIDNCKPSCKRCNQESWRQAA